MRGEAPSLPTEGSGSPGEGGQGEGSPEVFFSAGGGQNLPSLPPPSKKPQISPKKSELALGSAKVQAGRVGGTGAADRVEAAGCCGCPEGSSLLRVKTKVRLSLRLFSK